MTKTITYILLVLITNAVVAQFAPPAGTTGSTAMYKDSVAFADWANNCSLQRGFKNISRPDSGYVNVGNELSCIGKAGDANFVSLGDGGYAVLTFISNIYNGPGYDFAVFENSFDGQFLELAHVEVSSDGINYYRFNSTSNTDTINQINSFGLLDATKINNLAGKYKANYGTPFDLEELSGIAGLDIMNISHIKIIDVIGSVNPLYASRDGNGRIINDPWPTEFNSGGFDLDGVGVIHSVGNGINNQTTHKTIVYPTQLKSGDDVLIKSNLDFSATLYDALGKNHHLTIHENHITLPEYLENGIYFLILSINSEVNSYKLVVKN